MRLLASLPYYVASTDANGLQLHQYATGVYGQDGFSVRVETEYPWHGTVTVNVQEAPAEERTLSLRLPAWCGDHTLTVNGGPADGGASDGQGPVGWLRITRDFKPGDTIQLNLTMPPRLTVPHPRVDAVRGCAAVERGPLVYCLEQADQRGGLDPDDALLDVAVPLAVRYRPDLLGGVTTVAASGRLLPPGETDGWPYSPHGTRPQRSGEAAALTAVPYYAWANRGAGAMRVWMPAVQRM
jgi:DUF1680 family protein